MSGDFYTVLGFLGHVTIIALELMGAEKHYREMPSRSQHGSGGEMKGNDAQR